MIVAATFLARVWGVVCRHRRYPAGGALALPRMRMDDRAVPVQRLRP